MQEKTDHKHDEAKRKFVGLLKGDMDSGITVTVA